MNIDDLTLGEIKKIQGLLGGGVQDSPYEVGQVYLIRTVTMIDTGRVVGATSHEIILEEAAWIADTGRFADALLSAEFGEVEPFPDGRVLVGRGSVIDACKIKTAPRKQK